jgi:hypothetical protein
MPRRSSDPRGCDIRNRDQARSSANGPLMQSRLEGASVWRAAIDRGGCYWRRTASPNSETVAREMTLACDRSRYVLPSCEGHLGQLSNEISV